MEVAVTIVGEFERPVVVVRGTPFAGGCGRLGPRVLHLDDHFLLARLLGRLAVFPGGRSLVERGEVDLLVLLGLEHHVRLEGLEDLRLELEHRELQQLDRLLQLRRHGQCLTELELQGRLEHWI